ncbi:uncharacterized protein LOC112501645, partial [Cynara cardunculus var. scolymus]
LKLPKQLYANELHVLKIGMKKYDSIINTIMSYVNNKSNN